VRVILGFTLFFLLLTAPDAQHTKINSEQPKDNEARAESGLDPARSCQQGTMQTHKQQQDASGNSVLNSLSNAAGSTVSMVCVSGHVT
jgi:hypothetical protein